MWDVKRYNYVFHNAFENAVFLRDILVPFKQPIAKEELIKNNWSIIKKINFQGELFLRDVSEINAYKGNVNKVPENSIIYSKINVRHGCVYYHEKGKAPFGVSSEYPTFTFAAEKVDGYYLKLVLRSREFKRLLNTKTSGISKARVKVDEFLDVQIPLPPLEEQKRMVANYNSKIQQAKEQEEKAKQLEHEIESYLFEALGIEKLEKKESVNGLQFVDFKNTSRWDTLFLTGSIPKLKAKYEICKFFDAISLFNKGHQNKSIRINSKDYPSDEFYYIGMEHIEKETGNLLELKKVRGKEIKSQTLKVPKGFLLYGKLRPYLNKYWVNKTDFNNIICSSEFFVFDIINTINKSYFLNVLSSKFMQEQISDKTSGARMPRINEEIFFNLQFPLPPLEIQTKITNHISGLKQQIKDLKAQAKGNREQAIQAFEQEIFQS